jgi:hypothetical protein
LPNLKLEWPSLRLGSLWGPLYLSWVWIQLSLSLAQKSLWSAQALLSSSSHEMRKRIHRTLPESSDMVGPMSCGSSFKPPTLPILRWSDSTAPSSLRCPSAMCPVRTYSSAMRKQLTSATRSERTVGWAKFPQPDLTNLAVVPFTHGSDEGKQLHKLTMQRGCTLTPEKALYELVKRYVANEPIGMYGPTAATRLKGPSAFYSNQPPAPNNQPPAASHPTAAQIKEVVNYQAFQASQSSTKLPARVLEINLVTSHSSITNSNKIESVAPYYRSFYSP